MKLTMRGKGALTAGALALLTVYAIFTFDEEIRVLRGSGAITPARRSLSVNLGDGNCAYAPPNPDVDPNINFHKYVLAGYPSGDKRMAFIQMEALTGLPSKDDWDFVHNGYSNAPFIKTNYPHPSGVWSWGSEANEVALVVQFIRRNLVEYGDILWYQQNAPTYNAERALVERKYGERMLDNDFYIWRDTKVLEEIYRYGAYIDFWMENGRRRDPFSHRDISQEMWEVYTNPKPILNREDEVHICHKTSSPSNPVLDMIVSGQQAQVYLDAGDYLGLCSDAQQDTSWWDNAPIHYTISRDPHCQNIEETCAPSMVISADKLRSYTEGHDEVRYIARRLNMTLSDYMIADEAWVCLWDEIIHKNNGPKSFDDRQLEDDPNFSAFMIGEMVYELDRMITKYSADSWASSNSKATRLVTLFTEHRQMLQTELNDVRSGERSLSSTDYLGPAERTSEAELISN